MDIKEIHSSLHENPRPLEEYEILRLHKSQHFCWAFLVFIRQDSFRGDRKEMAERQGRYDPKTALSWNRTPVSGLTVSALTIRAMARARASVYPDYLVCMQTGNNACCLWQVDDGSSNTVLHTKLDFILIRL